MTLQYILIRTIMRRIVCFWMTALQNLASCQQPLAFRFPVRGYRYHRQINVAAPLRPLTRGHTGIKTIGEFGFDIVFDVAYSIV